MFSQTLATALVALGVAPLILAADPYPIRGCPVPSGSNPPMRRNINELQNAGGPQWDLYLLALADMQSQDYHTPLSYFQISGIHGSPFIEWNNTGGPSYDDWGGYCPHGEELFLSWHRPYVLLFEQSLVATAVRIAKTYPPKYRQQYVLAAETLRSPFWDWAAVTSVPPSIVPAKVSVQVPNGERLAKRSINNPLATHSIPREVLAGEYGEFDSQHRAKIQHCPSPDKQPASADARLRQSPYRQWMYDAFTRGANFSDFATQSNKIVSLEIIHNGIHWDAACGQQFVSPALAGFDPIFMLHHTNIDRVWSMWQVMQPKYANFQGSYSGGSRFTTPSGSIITPKSSLMPFFAGGRQAHTSESVASIEKFGYTYEGLEYWHQSQQQMADNCMRIVNRLYGPWSGSLRKRQQASQTPTERYFARISFDRADVPKPCKVQISLREKQEASFVVVAQPPTGPMSAGVPLNSFTGTTEIKAMSDEDTLAAIRKDLKVTIVKLDGSIDDSVIKSLKISLESVKVTPPKSETAYPKYGIPKVSALNAVAALVTSATKQILPLGGDEADS